MRLKFIALAALAGGQAPVIVRLAPEPITTIANVTVMYAIQQ